MACKSSNLSETESDVMQKKRRERFKELCEHAEVVEDTNKLGKIAKEIDRILDDELDRLKNIRRRNPTSIQNFDDLFWVDCDALAVVENSNLPTRGLIHDGRYSGPDNLSVVEFDLDTRADRVFHPNSLLD
jgi:hypothetical protein